MDHFGLIWAPGVQSGPPGPILYEKTRVFMLPNAISHEKTRVLATIWAPRAQFWHPGFHLEVPGCVWFALFNKLIVSVNFGFSELE